MASLGPAVKLTVILPTALLAILIIYNATLDGSGDGVRAYMGEWCALLLCPDRCCASCASFEQR